MAIIGTIIDFQPLCRVAKTRLVWHNPTPKWAQRTILNQIVNNLSKTLVCAAEITIRH